MRYFTRTSKHENMSSANIMCYQNSPIESLSRDGSLHVSLLDLKCHTNTKIHPLILLEWPSDNRGTLIIGTIMDPIKGKTVRPVEDDDDIAIDATIIITSPNLLGGPIVKLTRQFNLKVKSAKDLQQSASKYIDEWLTSYIRDSYPDEPLTIEVVTQPDPNNN